MHTHAYMHAVSHTVIVEFTSIYRRLAGALGIENPEISTFKSLQFSDSLKEEAK